MAKVLELLDYEFKTTMINVLRALMEKLDNMQEYVDKVSREIETLRQNQKEVETIKNVIKEMKDAFKGSPI